MLWKEEGVFSVSIFNINGERLFNRITYSQTESINLEFIPDGVYIMELNNNEGIKAYRKFVLQH